MKRSINFAFLFLICVLFISPKLLLAQHPFEKSLRGKMDSLIAEKGEIRLTNFVILPNNSVQSIMTPSGWGGGNATYLFAVVGGVFPALYADPEKADLIAAAGLSFGDPVKYVNVSASVNTTRVSELRDFSVNLILSRQIFRGSSISVGGLQLLASPSVSDAAGGTYYIAFSHAVQSVRSKTPGYSGLGYTIGYGNGRFRHKSPLDSAAGKGRYGTGFFANVSYEIIRQININAEWSGMNLGFSSGVRPLKGSPLTIGFGIYNLTKYAGDRIQFIGSIGMPISLDRKKKELKN